MHWHPHTLVQVFSYAISSFTKIKMKLLHVFIEGLFSGPFHQPPSYFTKHWPILPNTVPFHQTWSHFTKQWPISPNVGPFPQTSAHFTKHQPISPNIGQFHQTLAHFTKHRPISPNIGPFLGSPYQLRVSTWLGALGHGSNQY